VKPASVAGLEADREGFGDDAAAVAALWVIEGSLGNDASAQLPGFDLKPCLLAQFTQGAFQEGLLLVQVAAGQGQQPMPGKAAAQHQEHLPGSHHERVGGIEGGRVGRALPGILEFPDKRLFPG